MNPQEKTELFTVLLATALMLSAFTVFIIHNI